MHLSTKAAALVVIASTLAACSGGGSLTPNGSVAPNAPTPETIAASSNTGASRFIKGAVTATNSSDFDYAANPPSKPFESASGVSANALPSPSQCEQAFGAACYTPAEIRTAYNVPANLDGSGQTIVIVDAYSSPTIQQDLSIFDAVMGLPNPAFNIIYPSGQPDAFDASNPTRISWASETSLDVQWAHAIAPKATIDLVVAKTSHSSDLNAAEDYAVQHHLGSVVSMSFGASEPAIPGGATNKYLQHADSLFQQAKDAGITMVASTGDFGASNGTATLTPQFPASDPLVLSVGGTSLFMSDSGTYQSETVWNDSDASLCPFGCLLGTLPAATGGAPSSLFKAPSYQQSLFHPASREVADVSYNAGLYTAVLVVQGFRTPGLVSFYFVGGTSAGAPQWAGVIALADQSAGHALGFVNQGLYNVAKAGPYSSAFHDVTVGNNSLFGLPGESAGTGYDMPTGLGSPNVANLIPALIQNL